MENVGEVVHFMDCMLHVSTNPTFTPFHDTLKAIKGFGFSTQSQNSTSRKDDRHSFQLIILTSFQDICEMNIMVNYYRYDDDLNLHEKDIRVHRKSGRLCYAFMDFNQSIILPADTCIRTCRRPAQEAWHGFGGYKPWDISLGEPTYNPFAHDVGMLGNLFRTYLMVSVKHIGSNFVPSHTIITGYNPIHARMCSSVR